MEMGTGKAHHEKAVTAAARTSTDSSARRLDGSYPPPRRQTCGEEIGGVDESCRGLWDSCEGNGVKGRGVGRTDENRRVPTQGCLAGIQTSVMASDVVRAGSDHSPTGKVGKAILISLVQVSAESQGEPMPEEGMEVSSA